jgi:DNA-binding NarL/FixJ family response regulator
MKVLLVDAFPMMRAALTGLIEQHFAGAQVHGVDSVAAASSCCIRSIASTCCCPS